MLGDNNPELVPISYEDRKGQNVGEVPCTVQVVRAVHDLLVSVDVLRAIHDPVVTVNVKPLNQSLKVQRKPRNACTSELKTRSSHRSVQMWAPLSCSWQPTQPDEQSTS